MWVDAEEKQKQLCLLKLNGMIYQKGRGARFKEETIKNTSEEQRIKSLSVSSSSSNTLINPNALRNLAYVHPEYQKDGVTVFERAIENTHTLLQ